MDADVEAESRLVAMEGGYHGHDGIRHWWQQLFDAWPDYQGGVSGGLDLFCGLMATPSAMST
jgi:hypothetical protein